MSKQIKFTETALRDGQQSQIATRMPIEDMLPILETMDQAGYYSGAAPRSTPACVTSTRIRGSACAPSAPM